MTVSQLIHCVRVRFINQLHSVFCNGSYHLAEKKIASIHGQTAGLKLEQFIFDAFPYAPSTALFEVLFNPSNTNFLSSAL